MQSTASIEKGQMVNNIISRIQIILLNRKRFIYGIKTTTGKKASDAMVYVTKTTKLAY